MQYLIISGIINAITTLLLGVFLLRFKNSKSAIAFSVFCWLCFGWSVCYVLWQLSGSAEQALFWLRFSKVFAIYISLSYFTFAILFLNLWEKFKYVIYAFLALFSLVELFVFSPYYIPSVALNTTWNFYWPEAGIVFHAFLAAWGFLLILSNFLLITEIRNTTGARKMQTTLVCIGLIIGFFGGSTNYILYYDIPLYPFGNILVTVFVLCTAYAITRYKLFDIRFTLKNSVLKFTIATLIATFAAAIVYTMLLLQLDPIFIVAVATVTIIAALYLASYIFQYVLAREEYSFYVPDPVLLRNDTAAALRDWEATLRGLIIERYKYPNPIIFQYDWVQHVYRTHDGSKQLLRAEHALIDFQMAQHTVLLREELPKLKKVIPDATFREISLLFKRHNLAAIIPLYSSVYVHGIVFLTATEFIPEYQNKKTLERIAGEFGSSLERIQNWEALMSQIGKPEDKPKQVIE